MVALSQQALEWGSAHSTVARNAKNGLENGLPADQARQTGDLAFWRAIWPAPHPAKCFGGQQLKSLRKTLPYRPYVPEWATIIVAQRSDRFAPRGWWPAPALVRK